MRVKTGMSKPNPFSTTLLLLLLAETTNTTTNNTTTTITVTKTVTITQIIERAINLPLRDIVVWFIIGLVFFLIIRGLWKWITGY